MNKITAPQNLAELITPEGKARIQQQEDRLNALAGMRVQLNNSDGSSAGQGVIQISGDSAVLVITLN